MPLYKSLDDIEDIAINFDDAARMAFDIKLVPRD